MSILKGEGVLTTQQLVAELERIVKIQVKGFKNKALAHTCLASLKMSASFTRQPVLKKASWKDFQVSLSDLHYLLTKKLRVALSDDVQETVACYLQLKTPPRK